MTKESTWLQEQGIKFNNRLQKAIEEEFSRTHDIIMKDYIPKETAKDRGTMRNINNYRMKLWCDMFIEYKKGGHDRQTSASSASKDLQMFDLQFNL
jgi:hypothetical protein